MIAPVITIFVRHSAGCKYAGDEFTKRCNCPKHLRWTQDGRQHRRSAHTRAWAQAEGLKHRLAENMSAFPTGSTQNPVEPRTIARAIQLFCSDKKNQGLTHSVVMKYERELERFNTFCEMRHRFNVRDINLELLTEFRENWPTLYPSSNTRVQIQARLRTFLHFCFNAGWLERVPKMSGIKAEEPPTLPLPREKYETLLATVPKKFDGLKAAKARALIQLMRYSALAIRDAVTLPRHALAYDAKKKFHRVSTSRQKTGLDVSVPIPHKIAKEIMAVVNDNPKYFFWNGTGKATSAVTNWQHDLRTVFRAAFGDDTDFTPHCLRDTAAVEWLIAGIPLPEVSKLLGHSSIKTTEQSYSPWVAGRQDRLDNLVTGTWDRS